ncbi:MAG: 3'-5' exonuclease [Bacteroidales bacterium]|nr:3'-5' exonuclease [Bacteroidales bacterium]MCM1422501.1 3'-5' exonuclease [bacterium]
MTDTFVCIDLETTGLQPKSDKIIEIGAVRVEEGRITGEWESLVNPERELEERIVELTGIRDEQLADAKKMAEVLPELLEFLGDRPLLGHCVHFDFAFLKRAAAEQKLSFERKGIDTLKIARKYLQELESRSLGALCLHYEIPHKAHRALDDARATTALYGKLAEEFYEKEAAEGEKNLFVPRQLIHHIKREKPITIPQKEQLYKLLEKHKLKVDYEIESLTRSEATRKIHQLLAEYR